MGRYLLFLLTQLADHILIWLLYWYPYINRDTIRTNYPSTKVNKFWWGFLHNSLVNNEPIGIPCDYGDGNFVKANKKGDSKLDMFLLSWKWVRRNPMHNKYYTKNKLTGKQTIDGYNVTCHRKGLSPGLWRTIKFKFLNEDGSFTSGDKHGKYIDFDKAIIGTQRYYFTMNDEKYFRKSAVKIWPIWGNTAIIHEYKFGFEHINWSVQYHWGIKKFVKEEYNNFKINKNKYVSIK